MAFGIFTFVALIMITIGVVQLKSRKPVGFYSGEMPPRPEELTDVRGWNKEHGTMWILFGGAIVAGGLIGLKANDIIWSSVFMIGSVVVPLPLMVWNHGRLKRKYMG